MRGVFHLDFMKKQRGREPPTIKKGKWLLVLLVLGFVMAVWPQPKQAASCSVLAVTNTSKDYQSAADIVGSRCVINVRGLSDTRAAVAVKQKADQVDAEDVVTMGGTIAFPAEKNKVIAQAVNRTVVHVGGQDRYATKNMLRAFVHGRSIYQVAQLEDSGRTNFPIHRVSCPYEANRTSYCYAIPHYGGAIDGAAQYRYTPPVIHWRLRLSVSDQSLWIRQYVTITVRTSYKLSGTPYYINIWRGDHLLKTCSSGTVCSVRDRRTTPGSHTYQATVSDYRSTRHTQDRSGKKTVKWMQPNRPPTARFTTSPGTIYHDTRVSFHNQSSDLDGDRLRFRWQFQAPHSGSWQTFSIQTQPDRVFTEKGTWRVRLVATDPDGATDTYTRSFTVRNRKPIARFRFWPLQPTVGEAVQFSNQSGDPDDRQVSYSWTLRGPGNRVRQIKGKTNPIIHFDQAGSWQITLHVTDPYGGKDNVSQTIEVSHTYQAAVHHTSAWQQKRRKAHLDPSRFLPGEAFLLTATADPHASTIKVYSPFHIGESVLSLNREEGVWKAVLEDSHFHQLKSGTYPFTFVFHFDDGRVRKLEERVDIGGQLNLSVHLTQ